MRFFGIDVPDELIAAHADGNVVFFVGAGASVPAPTRLPLFGELSKQVARELGADEPVDEDLKNPDVFLGRLNADDSVDVHQLVARLIGKRRRRNELHDALASVAAAPGTPRLVTTNYDDYLHKALTAAKVKHDIYEAPALPLGNDFEGLVHLHGRLGQPPRRLVVTDGDFGAAYVTRGWAPAFLRDLFSRFVVCFVGYSHDDRMMDYFAKGLPSDARQRYIVTDRNESQHWEQRGIIPIYYPPGEHRMVIDLLTRWGTWARDTPFDRARRVRALAADAPPADPDEHDFLVASLEDRTLAAEVCHIATSPPWVVWMADRRPFRQLLGDPLERRVSDRVLMTLAHWTARTAVAPGTFEAVYRAVSESAYPATAELAIALVMELATGDVLPEHGSAWLRWVLTVAPREHKGLLDALEMLWTADVELHFSDALLLLEFLATSWSLGRRPWFGSVRSTELDVSRSALNKGVNRRLKGLDATARRELLTWLTGYFGSALRRTGRPSYDPWSSWRSSISPHSQDALGHSAAQHVLIDLARDSLAEAFTDDAAFASRLRDVMLDSPVPLLRRVAIHSLGAAGDLSVADQVGTLLARRFLFARELRHEVYELIAARASELDADGLGILVDAIVAGPEAPADELHVPRAKWRQLRDRQVFELLHWLQRHRPGMGAPPELEALTNRYPEWIPRENPHLSYSFSGGARSIEDEWPWPPEKFHRMLQDSPSAAVRGLGEHTRRDDDPWWPAGDMLSRTVQTWPNDGFEVWAESAAPAVRNAIIEGWSQAPMADEELNRVAALLLEADPYEHGRAIARLLRPWTNDSIRDRWVSRSDGQKLARRAFASANAEASPVDTSDIYVSAVNSGVGTLADYWLGVAAHEAREGQYPGGGLSTHTAAAFSELISDSQVPEHAIAPLLAQLEFLYRADPQWTQANLLHRLDPTRAAWSEIEPLWAVVLRGRFSDDLLDAGLREWLPIAARLVASDSMLSTDLARVAALVTVHSTMDDGERLDWMARFVRSSADSLLVPWVTEVAEIAGELTDEARSSLWNRWMRPHLKKRVTDLPKNLSPAEATASLSWIAILPTQAEVNEAVDLILEARIGFDPSADVPLLHDLDPVSSNAHPQAWLRLIAGMLQHTTSLDSHTAWALRRVSTKLGDNGVGEEYLSEIRRALYNLGHGER